MTPWRGRLLLFAAAMLSAAVVKAESAYVIDKLLVGVHQEKSLDSEIVKVLPTGTLLEVVERDGDLVLIRDPDGVTGWVDATYLMKDKPAALQVGELESKTRQLQAELADALAKLQEQQTQAAGDTAPGDTQTEESQRQAEELEKRLSSERLKRGELEAQLRDAEARQRQTQAELEALRATNSQAATPATQAASADSITDASSDDVSLAQLAGDRTVQILAAAVLVLLVTAFAGGVYFMDYVNRRRHGGFRI